MFRRFLPVLLLLPVCCNEASNAACSGDRDCKGGRVCVSGLCSTPKPQNATAPSTPSATPTAGNSGAPAKDDALSPVLGDFCFQGSLGDKKISGALRAQGARVTGEYLTAGGPRGSALKLTGTRDGSTVKLNEQAKSGTVSGSFEGTVHDGSGHYIGTWSNPGGAKKLPFDLSPTGCGPEYW